MEINDSIVQDVAKAAFPHDALISCSRIPEGYSHYMYRCKFTQHGDLILRIARPDQKEETNLDKELWVMKAFENAGVIVPKIILHDFSEKKFPFHYLFMTQLRGKPLDTLLPSMSEHDKKIILHDVGVMLAKMHSITMPDFGDVLAGGIIKQQKSFQFRQIDKAPPRSTWVAYFFEEVGEQLSELLSYGVITSQEASKIITFVYSKLDLIKESRPVLAHLDLMTSHIFIEDGKIMGIIDFEFSQSYPAEFDFVKFSREGLLDDPLAKKALLDGYGREKLSSHFDELVVVYRIVRDLGLSRYTAKSGDLDKCHKTLQRILSVIE